MANIEYINKQALIDKLDKLPLLSETETQKALKRGVISCKYIIKDFPTIEIQEPKVGHWIKEKTIYGWDNHSYQCSECGRSIHLDTEVEDLTDYPYCHCGAKMKGEK